LEAISHEAAVEGALVLDGVRLMQSALACNTPELIEKATAASLKQFLKLFGIASTGNKAELILRSVY
jgi:hypothetical protein